MPRWRVDIIRKRAEHLSTVEAATEREAIEKAAERFEIPPIGAIGSRCRRLARIRISDRLRCCPHTTHHIKVRELLFVSVAPAASVCVPGRVTKDLSSVGEAGVGRARSRAST
jgi:hypothetical protein